VGGERLWLFSGFLLLGRSLFHFFVILDQSFVRILKKFSCFDKIGGRFEAQCKPDAAVAAAAAVAGNGGGVAAAADG